MEELDLLKKAWKKDTQSFQQISETEIYKMIHKKSSSIVKWILMISIIEFIFWTVINIVYLGENYLRQQYSKDVLDYVLEINTVYNIISYVVVAFFIYLFYKNYRRISTTSSTKQLMGDILRTRKTVIYYIWFNILLFVVGSLTVMYVQLNYDSQFSTMMEKFHNDTSHIALLKYIGFIVLFMSVTVLGIWLFYKLIYGLLLRKLNKNYKELQKIDL